MKALAVWVAITWRRKAKDVEETSMLLATSKKEILFICASHTESAAVSAAGITLILLIADHAYICSQLATLYMYTVSK